MNPKLYSRLMEVIIGSGLQEEVVMATVAQLTADLAIDQKEIRELTELLPQHAIRSAVVVPAI